MLTVLLIVFSIYCNNWEDPNKRENLPLYMVTQEKFKKSVRLMHG